MNVDALLPRLDGSLVQFLRENFDDFNGQSFYHASTHANKSKHRDRIKSILSALHFILKIQEPLGWKTKTRERLKAQRNDQYTTAHVEADMRELEKICNTHLNQRCTVSRRSPRPKPDYVLEVLPTPKNRVFVEKRNRNPIIVDSPDPPKEESVLNAVIHKRPVVAETLSTLRCLTKLKQALRQTEQVAVLTRLYKDLHEELKEYIGHYERGIKEVKHKPMHAATKHMLREYETPESRSELVYGTRHTLGWVVLKRNRTRPSDGLLWRSIREVRHALYDIASQEGAPLVGSDQCYQIQTPMARKPVGLTAAQRGTPSGRPINDNLYPTERPLSTVQRMSAVSDPFFQYPKSTLLYGVGTETERLRYLVRLF